MIKEILAYICWGIALVLIVLDLTIRFRRNPRRVAGRGTITQFGEIREAIDHLGSRLTRGQNWMFALQYDSAGCNFIFLVV